MIYTFVLTWLERDTSCQQNTLILSMPMSQDITASCSVPCNLSLKDQNCERASSEGLKCVNILLITSF